LKEVTTSPSPRLMYVSAEGCELFQTTAPPLSGHWVRLEDALLKPAPIMVEVSKRLGELGRSGAYRDRTIR
jgi:hypothetical protein